jgi:hypothetical protein
MIRTGVCHKVGLCRTDATTSWPLRSGMRRSSTTSSGTTVRISSRASRPVVASIGRYPACRSASTYVAGRRVVIRDQDPGAGTRKRGRHGTRLRRRRARRGPAEKGEESPRGTGLAWQCCLYPALSPEAGGRMTIGILRWASHAEAARHASGARVSHAATVTRGITIAGSRRSLSRSICRARSVGLARNSTSSAFVSSCMTWTIIQRVYHRRCLARCSSRSHPSQALRPPDDSSRFRSSSRGLR